MKVPGEPAIDLSARRRLHVVGAGGAGMSAIAAVLAAMGHRTTGSDLKASPSLERLRACGVQIELGHRPENVAGVDAVTLSTAVAEDNIEVREAHRRGIPVLSRAAMLAAIVALRRTIAVAGTHGKTTTSSMLALVLVEAGLRPSFIIGGEVNEIGTNAAWDEGEWLIVEADESDGTFLQLAPEIGIVTSVESDHLEYYGSFEALKAAFSAFFRNVGLAIVCADDPVAASLAPASALTYGSLEGRDDAGRGHRLRSQRGAFRAGPRRTRASASSSCRCPASTTPATPPGQCSPPCSSGSIPSRPAVPSPASPGSRGVTSSGERSAG